LPSVPPSLPSSLPFQPPSPLPPPSFRLPPRDPARNLLCGCSSHSGTQPSRRRGGGKARAREESGKTNPSVLFGFCQMTIPNTQPPPQFARCSDVVARLLPCILCVPCRLSVHTALTHGSIIPSPLPPSKYPHGQSPAPTVTPIGECVCAAPIGRTAGPITNPHSHIHTLQRVPCGQCAHRRERPLGAWDG
jgi:hypothetical protein